MFGSSFFKNFGIPEYGDIGAAMPETYGANAPIMDPLAKAVVTAGKSAVNMFKAPGQLMTANPYPEGSEAWQFFEDSRQKGMEEWSRDMALNTMGTGAIAGVPLRVGETALGTGAIRAIEGPETLSWAAIRYNGKIYLGQTHADAIEEAVKDTGKSLDQVADEIQGRPSEDSGGFYTSKNRYVTRREAEEIIKKQPTELQTSVARMREEGLHADAIRLTNDERRKGSFDLLMENINPKKISSRIAQPSSEELKLPPSAAALSRSRNGS